VRDAGGTVAGSHDLLEDVEQLERVLRSDDEVVVGVPARVEVEAAEPSARQQERNDVRDVGPKRMVAGVDEYLDFRPQFQRQRVGGAPIGYVGVIEGRLEEL